MIEVSLAVLAGDYEDRVLFEPRARLLSKTLRKQAVLADPLRSPWFRFCLGCGAPLNYPNMRLDELPCYCDEGGWCA